MRTIKWLFSYIKPYKGWFILNTISLLLKTIISIAVAYFVQWLVQNTVDGSSMDKMYSNVTFLSIFIICGVGITYLSNYSNARYGNGAMRSMKEHLARHVRDLTVQELDNSHSGDLVSRMNNDIYQVQQFVKEDISNMIYLPIMGLSAAAYMLTLNWKLLFLSFILTPPSMMLANKFRSKVDGFARQYNEHMGKGNSVIQDMIGGIGIVKAFHIEKDIHKKYADNLDEALKCGVQADKYAGLSFPCYIVLAEFPRIICLLVGGLLAINGNLQLGALIAFLQLLAYVIEPAAAFPYLMMSLSNTQGAAERIMEILEKPLERKDGEKFLPNPEEVLLKLEQVGFSYKNGYEVLKGLSLEIKKGQIHALVGSSGSGKSTVLKLLCGFYDIDKGDIKLYGECYSKWNLEQLRKNFAVVSQEVYLFPGSIRDNIAYGKPDATEAEIIEASKTAYAHDFIMNFEEGYETMVGERGVRLSGGQKQRISIARAILKNAPVLLLDEPTSALDTNSEKLVQKALDEFMKDRTVIIVAHRMSTIVKADEIFVLESGALKERGTHQELIDKKGAYFSLYERQLVEENQLEREVG
jgi:subfamily B ATP-binding cassette protein MsbA/ATP-binding cassette subfamily B protein AbcA/BmrA